MVNFHSAKTQRNIWRSAGLLFAAAAIYAIGYFFISGVFVPPAFSESRKESALIAKDIVSLTEKSLQNLDKIALEDRQYNFERALELVREELEHTKKSRLKAVGLTEKLVVMTHSAATITPVKARNLAIEAISNELSLISHLIVYNDVLNALLQTLEYKFSGDIRYDAQDVQILIKNMNQEVREINKLNDLFNQKMKEFDELAK
jgi:hypothetical protein